MGEHGHMRDHEQSGEKLYFVYLKAIIRGIVLSVVLLLITSFAFYFTNLSEKYMSSAIWVITVLGICYASIFGANRIGEKGVLHGIILGIIYICILGIVGLLSETGEINYISYAIMLSMGIVIGGMAGALGINIGKSQ
jgi:putative membrane protein (TIGR04086 family)